MGETDDTNIGPIDASDEIHIKYDPEVDAELDFPLRQVEGQPGSFYGHFTPKLTPREKPKAIYYGTAAHLGANELLRSLQDRARRADVSERPDYLEWAEPPWHGLKRDVAPGEEWTHYCTQARREITTRFSKCSCGRTRGDNLGDGLLRELRDGALDDVATWLKQEMRRDFIKAMDGGNMETEPRSENIWVHICSPTNEETRLESGVRCPRCGRSERPSWDDRYPGSDTPQQWSRRGLSEHIRLELQVLGLLPGDDGFVRPPEPWEHYCREVGHPVGTTADVCAGCGTARGEVSAETGVSEEVSKVWDHDCPGMLRQEDRRITLPIGQNCAECGAGSSDRGKLSGQEAEESLIDWDNIDFFKIKIDGVEHNVSKYDVQAVRKD